MKRNTGAAILSVTLFSVISGCDIPETSAAATPLIAAHRGTWVGGYPDNSAKAFVNTYRYAKILEADVMETSDHQPIFSHDSASTFTYAQMRAKGSASILDLRVHLRDHPGTYATIEAKQTSYSNLFWTNFNATLGKYASRIIFYSLRSNGQVRQIRLKYGYQGMYDIRPSDSVDHPTRAQINYVGTYILRSPCTFSASERSGIRWITGLKDSRSEFSRVSKCGPFGIMTNYAKTAVQNGW